MSERCLNKNICSAAFALCIAAPVGAAREADERWLTITWENDVIANEDSGYTNGMGVSWGRGPVDELTAEAMPGWLYYASRWLPYSNDGAYTHAVSYRIAQLMYTPDDIQSKALVEDDRPYAGLLLWSVNLHAYRAAFSNRYWLSLGAVGPISGAEQAQTLVHNMIGVDAARGWDHQLDNELTFALGNERLYRLTHGSFDNGPEFDLIGMGEWMAGTVRSEVGAGGGFRVGRNLRQSFSAASLVPGRNINPLAASLRFEWHAFVNVYGRYVFNDITLDGNYFSDSHSVTLTNEQAFVSVGAAWHGSQWGFVASVQESTRTFEERREETLFGSFSVTFRF